MISLRLLVAGLLVGGALMAQSVSPVIVEYKNVSKGAASGKLELTNNTQVPLDVVIEAKSFNITSEGRSQYRDLDPSIHLQLSNSSTRLQPGQSYYVFYKVKADSIPAWFTIYSGFSPPKHNVDGEHADVNMRVMLPHVVYLYQKTKLTKPDIKIKDVTYVTSTHKVVCDLENVSVNLGRVQKVTANGEHSEAQSGGFPLLPGIPRHLEMDWTATTLPKKVAIAFENFTITMPIETITEGTQNVEPTSEKNQ